jgi:hypothetical protein
MHCIRAWCELTALKLFAADAAAFLELQAKPFPQLQN